MYILKNAVIAIKRNLGRNVLIGIIIMAIACLVSITLAIKNTAFNLISSYESSYEKEATLSINRSSMRDKYDFSNADGFNDAKNAFNNIQAFTMDDIVSFGDSEYIDNYYYTYQIGLNGLSIEKVSTDFSFGGGKGFKQNSTSDFKVIGYSDISAMEEFISGSYKMIEITDDAWNQVFSGNYVFINSELALMNEVSLNDTITLIDADDKEYDFIVVGIFEEVSSDSTEPSFFSSSANSIITGTEYLSNIFKDNTSSVISPVFILNSFDDVENFQNELYEKGLDESYIVSTNEESFESSISSVSNVSSFVTTFLILTLVIGAIVLFIINMINIRERKYEIGVFRTVGMSKIKLTMQFLFELVLVAIVSLLIGAGIGAISSKSVGNYLLANEIASADEKKQNIQDNMGMTGKEPNNTFIKNVSNIQAYSSIDAVVNAKIVFELMGIGLVLVFVSSLSAMISIQRFSPLSILKERS